MLTVLVIALGGSGKLFAADENVAKVGNTEYATIGEAIAAWTNGTTLTLLADVTLSDVIQLSSTEMHTLDLSSFTMTAASKKDAIQIVNNGRSSASYALDIKADATNPGGITATGKTVVVTTGKSGVKDRPIIRFYNGVFNGSNIVKHSGSNGTNCPQFQFHGGVFNGTISTNRALNQFYGGVFNGSLMMSVDSSAYTLIAGGTFKQLSNLYGSALNSGKFTIGSAKGVYDKEVYIDDNGNYVIAAAEPSEGIEAAVAKTPGTNDYLAYSKVATEGQLNYTDVEVALKNNNTTSAKVTVYAEEVDMDGINFKGTIVVPEGKTVKIVNAPEGLKTEGNVVIVKPVAKIGDVEYLTLQAAVEEAQAGDEIVVIANFADVTVNVTKNLTISGNVTLNNVGINANGADALTVKGLTFTGNSWINSGTAEALTVSGVTANVAPNNTSYTNSRSAFISLGRSEGQELALTVENSNITVTAAGADAVLGWAKITTATITGNVIKGSSDGYFTNADAIKFMAIANGAEFVVNNNEIYSNYNGIVFAQNTTRDNAYSVSADANKFYGGADHIWIEISGGNTVHATFNATSANTVNGNAFTVADIKYHSSVIKNWTSYAGVDVVTDSNGKVIGGTLASYSNAESVAEGYEIGAGGVVGKASVAEVNGTKYTSIEAALDVATAGSEIKLLADIEGDITVPAKVTLNGNGFAVSGTITAAGEITFAGVTKTGNFGVKNTNTVVNIPAGASLQLTGTDRMVIGHGCTFNITGTIAENAAKTADKATLTPSLVMPGASFTGAGVTFNVTNAYISAPSSYCSSSKSASGTFDFNITNSIWENAGKLAFESQSTAATVNFDLKNSVLNTGSHLVFGVSRGEVVVDNSNVNVGKSNQIENQSTMTIKNGSVVNGSVATSSNAKNPGTVIVENATYAVTGEFSGSDLGIGTLIIKKGATVSAGSITKANITIDAEGMTASDAINLTANLSKLAGELSVINNDKLEAKIVDGKIVLAAKPVAKIGETPYATLESAFKAATSGCTIDILLDVTVDYAWDARKTGGKFTVPVTINGNGNTIKFTAEIKDNNWNTVFRFEENATVKNLTVDIANATGAQRVISAKKSLNVDGLTIVGTAKYGIIFGEGANATDLAATEIVVKNSILNGTRRAISDNEGGKDVKSVVITGNTLKANAYISASESIEFNNNTANGEVDLRSYTAENVLSVEAKGNTLTEGVKNYIYAKTIDAQDEFETENPPLKVSNKAELVAALAAAKEGNTITLTADIDYGTDQLAITKNINLNLGGNTLTTRNPYGGMSVKGNPTIKNGTIVHASNTAAIKVWNATAFEDLVIDVQGKGDANKTIGGIVLQSGSTTRVGSIKNVTIKGAALTNGIETYNCGDATANVIGSMEDVTIDANGTAMLISAPCGTATNCSFTGDVNAIEISIKGNYSASLNLVDCVVVGGVFAHDEFSSNPDIVNNGTLSFTADEATTGASVEDVTLTIARAEAEKVIGVLKDVMDNAKAKVNDTYYLTLTDAIAAAKAGDVVTVFAGTYAMPSMKAGITIVGEGEVVFNGTLSGTLENLTMKNIHIKGSDAQRWAYAKGDLVFDNVTFEATGVYALHFDGITAGATLLYKDCTIIGWAALGGSPASCIFEGCTIKGNGSYGVIRTYFNTTIKDCTFDVANVNTTDVYQDGIHAVSGATVTVNNCTNVNGDMKDIVYVADTSKVIVGEVVIKNTVSVTIGEKTNYYMTLAEAFAAIGEGAVVIELLDNATLNYGAREAYGTAETTSLTINGNGKVLTLNQTNSDWSSFGLANENAKVVFNNMKIEKTGKGDTSGAWNTHAIIFSSNVEMNNLIVNNAIAVQAGAILNNVAINEANGYYGLWINGNGQEVTMNGGSITATNGGRGIKIADQYIDNPAQVTLNVTGTVFTTAKKAAVLVSSKAGAEIAASKVNIENVAEDTVNFVWVDEDWAANFGNVEVTGATVAQEGKGSFVAAVEKDAKVQAYYKDLHAAMVAAKAGETVVLIKDVDLAGTEWEPVSFGGTFDGNGKTISNLTINKPGVSNTGFIKSLNGTVKNITFTSPTVKGGENTAVVAGRAGGSAALAENITINGTIKVETTHSGYARAAAIVGGWAYGNYKNITVDGGDKANSYIKHAGGGDGRYVAGIVGHADDVNSYVNCTVKNITISGGWLCGGIAGPGPADKLASNCSVENIDINADYSGGMFGWYYGAGTIENATIKNVTFTDGSTNNGVVGGYGHNTDATVTNLTFESVQNSNGAPLLDHVASIGNNHYFTLADAVNAATDGQTIELLWSEGKAPIAMNASLYGKSVTITGTAIVDWSKGFLFVGRGGKGNATLIFDGAKLTSASNNASTGIHVSGREKNTSDKYDGTVVIKNSTIVLDYLINKGAMTLDNATLTVKNGFAIGGRPAKETESGVDETATIALTNGSKVVVNNHNGMGLGYEAIGVMNISSGSTFECTQDFLVTAKGTMNVNGGVVTTDVKITNNGVINVSGESTLDIASFEGKDINFLDGATIKNSTIGGNVFVAGNVTFRGANTFAMLYDYGTLTDYYGTTAPMKWTVEEGASVTLTTAARYGLGYGDNVTIIGSIDNALTARENITENDRSLFMHGLVAQESKGWNCESALTVKNAYVVIGSNNSFGNKSGNYGGTYTFNINNSVVDASRITFYEALSTTTFTIDGSDVKMGTFMTRDADSKFVLKNSKVLSTTTSNGTDEGNYNKGELTLVNSSLTYSAEFKHEAGEINLDLNSLLTAPAISGAGTINVDAADFVIGSEDVHVVKANMSDFTGTINVDNNNYVIAEITETGVVIKEKELEGEGTVDNPYELETLTELELFRNKVNAGDNHAGKYVKLSADVNLAATRSANNWEPIGTKANPFKGTFDGADYTISNLVVEGENYVGLFGYADDATIKNVTIKNANVKGVECVGVIAGNVYSTSLIDNCHVKGNITVEGQTSVGGIVGKYYTKVSNCSVIGDGVATSYVKGTYVKSDFEGDNIGGIMGHGGENNRFTGNTVKNITISGTRKVGGVVGVTDKATQVVNCVVENVNIETTATAEYAASNKAKSGHGAIVGSYTTGGTAGLVADCVVKNVNFINEDNVTVSAGPITGGARGGSYSMLAPEGVTSSNNDIYMSTITGSNNDYLMNAVAKIGNVEYYALQDAINAGGEVTVISAINLTEGVTVAAGKEVVLDLNGFAVSYTSSVAGKDMITNRGDLTIVDGSTAKTGKITYKNTDTTANNVTVSTISTEPGSTLVVNGGTIENKTVKADGSSIYSYAIDLLTNGNLGDVNVTINGGTVRSDYMAIRQFNNGTACKNSLTINGGYIYGAKRAVQVHMDNNAAYTTIVNGKVEAGDYSLCFLTTSENISVLGGEFIGEVWYSGTNGFITGGTFTTDVNDYCAENFSAIPQGPTWVVKQVKGTQTRELASAGWYWFSSYIDIEGEEGLADLQEALNGNAKEVRGQDDFTRYYPAYQSWTPGLNTVSTEEMYMINTTAPVTVSLDGNFVSEDRRITLNPGWNWIGYPVRVTVPVEDALAGFTPQEGDVIKSKSGGFSEYSEGAGGWFPSFDLVPGEGYKYYSEKTTSTSFVYSTTITNASASKGNVAAEYHWTQAAGEYAENMVVIAMLDINGEYANENYEVAAFANGECRGSARPIYNEKLDRHMLFMTVCGDEVEDLSFRCYDVNSGREYDLINRVVYSNDAVVGSMNEPYIFTCSTLGIGEATLSDINIYPNPTTTDREINLQATCDKVEVFNTLGVKVAEYQNVDTIDALETAGTYVIRVTLNGDVKHCRLVVK